MLRGALIVLALAVVLLAGYGAGALLGPVFAPPVPAPQCLITDQVELAGVEQFRLSPAKPDTVPMPGPAHWYHVIDCGGVEFLLRKEEP